MIRILLLGIALASCATPEKKEASAPEPVPKTASAACQQAGGKWRSFGNSCVDSCSYARAKGTMMCAQALTDGCDCGSSKCWDGKNCVAN